MPLRLRLGLLLFALVTWAHAQNLFKSPHNALEGQVYRLSLENARKAATDPGKMPEDDWFNNLYLTYPVSKGRPDDLPPGHYLDGKVVGNQVVWNYLQVPGFSVILENDGAHFMARVVDFEGRPIRNAQVTLEKQEVPYDSLTGTYKTASPESGGLLEVHALAMVQFYQVAHGYDYAWGNVVPVFQAIKAPAIKRFLWWPIRRFVINPVVWTAMFPYDVAKLIARRQPRGWILWVISRPSWARQAIARLHGTRHPVKFMLCSQPKFRQGDTVKVKAYLTDAHGSPLRSALKLRYTDFDGMPQVITTVKPVHPGCYVASFVLDPQLRLHLDRDVSLDFFDDRHPGRVQRSVAHSEREEIRESRREARWDRFSSRRDVLRSRNYEANYEDHRKRYERTERRINQRVFVQGFRGSGRRDYSSALASTSFRYEDYELNQITFSMRSESDEHCLGQPAVLYLEAKDMNGLTAPDARVSLKVTTVGTAAWQADHAYLPDSIWAWSGNLDPAGETRLEIPMHRFPGAVFSYNVSAECRTSDNELKTANLTLRYLHEQDRIEVTRVGDTVSVQLRRGLRSIPVEATVKYLPEGEGTYERTEQLMLPAKILWAGQYKALQIAAGAASRTWTPAESGQLQVAGQHRGDSLELSARAADGSEFTYHIFKGDAEFASGLTRQLHLLIPADREFTYHLSIHRIQNGRSVTNDYSYHWRKNDLQVAWKGPSTIYPGMTADIEVGVRTAKGRPVHRADVTAYAINSRFETSHLPAVPSASPPAIPRTRKAGWQAQTFAHRGGNLLLNYDRWAMRTGLDTLPWYQFLYPDTNLYLYRHPIEADKAEVAPFVVREGAIQPVQIVYIDGRPVYFAWTTPTMPYSFAVKPGKHRIEIRLPDFGLKIDSFMVEAGFKTILSIDPNHLKRQGMGRAMSTVPEGGEGYVIQQHTFGHRHGRGATTPAFVEMGDRFLLLGSGLAGPASPNDSMRVEVLDKFKETLAYEPGFEYEFGGKLVKMRSLPYIPTQFSYRPPQNLEDRPWVKDSIVARWRRSQAIQPSTTHSLRTQYDWRNVRRITHNGRLTLEVVTPRLPYSFVCVAFLDDPKNVMHVLPFNGNQALAAPVGKWLPVILLDDDHYVVLDSIDVRPDGQNFHRFHVEPEAVQDSFSHHHPEQVRRFFPKPVAPVNLGEYGSESWGPGAIKMDAAGSNMKRVTGRVSEASTGEGLAFAVLMCKGSRVGTVTAEDGSFSFFVPLRTDTIEVTSMGYHKSVIPWDRQARLDVAMVEEGVTLEAVPIIASQNVHISTDNYSASSISSADVVAVPSLSYAWSAGSGTYPTSLSLDAAPSFVVAAENAIAVPAFPQELLDQLAGQAVMRTDFRDNALWQPALRTAKKGMAAFRVKFPEDITRWDAYAIAVDRKGRTGLTRAAIRAWKPVAGRLAMPRFLYEGDTAMVVGKVMNYTGDSLQMRRRFMQGDQVLKEAAGACGPVQLDTLAVIPKVGADSFSLGYMADKADGYGDGEQWGVRVFRKGVVERQAAMAMLLGDTTFQASGFDLENGPVYVRAHSQMLKCLLTAIDKLGSYEHLCNEQLASKLMALLGEREIYKSMGKTWDGDSAVFRALRLVEKRHPTDQVGYGWWPGMPAQTWVSSHLLKAVTWARAAGYSVDVPFAAWPSTLLSQLDKRNPRSNLELLQFVQQIDSTMDIRKHIEALDTMAHKSIDDQIAIMGLRQVAGLPIDVDSLMARSRIDLFGRRCWGLYENYGWSPYRGTLQTTLQAYTILRRSGKSARELLPVLTWVLSNGSDGWGSTYLNAQVISTLARDVDLAAFEGKSTFTCHYDGKTVVIPVDSTVQLPATAAVELVKRGPGIGIVTVYQNRFNPAPAAIDSLFEIHTTFLGQDRRPVTELVAGEPVRLVVSVQVKHDASYLMLQVPIPASCSYQNKHQGYWNRNYVEYFREKAAFYFQSLGRGSYSFQIDLLPRYSGSFTLNAARMENMYFPVLSGQNEIRSVKVQ